MINKIFLLIEKVCTLFAAFLMLSLVFFSFLQIILRNFFDIGLITIEDFTRNGVLWITFIGAILTTLNSKHISIDILPQFIKGKTKKYISLLLAILSSIICLIFTWYAISFIRLEFEMKIKIAGILPIWIFEIIIPIGFFLIAVSFILKYFITRDYSGQQDLNTRGQR